MAYPSPSPTTTNTTNTLSHSLPNTIATPITSATQNSPFPLTPLRRQSRAPTAGIDDAVPARNTRAQTKRKQKQQERNRYNAWLVERIRRIMEAGREREREREIRERAERRETEDTSRLDVLADLASRSERLPVERS
ncbi:hypothetical protein CC80DRAFT_499342 [Byssothecium circinans]|uniref:Uncharacterized protein n=1 Tax=Byssothecium circinans TaxID=147558 RepID=A0A6A5UGH9_9PLEO|nr:hypothetical protein CC80DRAFT_499342 [Byssothecium circinans]